MNLHPWQEVIDNAQRKMDQGWTIYQQWNCEHCGAKQTMPDKDTFYLLGICEECNKQTDIRKNGHNFRADFVVKPGGPLPDLT